MAALSDVTAAAESYADSAVAAATAPLQQTIGTQAAQIAAANSALTAAQAALTAAQAIDATDAATIAAQKTTIATLNTTIAALQAQLTPPVVTPVYPYPINKYAPAAGETLPHFIQSPSTLQGVDFGKVAAQVSDFAQAFWNHSVHDTGGWGLLGNYVAAFLNADLSMVKGSSTHAAAVKALVKGDTTNFVAFRLGRGANPNVPVPSFFTGKLTGTDQGHQYTLMQSYETVKSIFGPFTMKSPRGIAGGQPPWETFGWGSYHDIDPTWTDFEIDGTDENGVPCAASGIGAGPQDKGGTYSYIRGFIHDLAYGGAITHYAVTNTVLNFTDMHFKNIPAAAINLEKANGSTVNIIRPNFENCAVDLVVDSDGGFATINIVDPVLTPAHPKIVVCSHLKYNFPQPDISPNQQLDPATNNHVTLTVNGIARPDLLSLVNSYKVNGVTM